MIAVPAAVPLTALSSPIQTANPKLGSAKPAATSTDRLRRRVLQLCDDWWSYRFVQADALATLRTLRTESVHTIVTSPPYYQTRSYDGLGPDQLGREPDPALYIEHLVAIFHEAKRVLRADGTMWIVIGSSYAGSGRGPTGHNGIGDQAKRQGFHSPGAIVPRGYKPKDMMPIPWLLGLALQADGWWLRDDVIWHKPNGYPNSYGDRPVTNHEYVLLLTKSRHCYFDWLAVYTTARLRTVWTVPTTGSGFEHYATFPPALVERPIRAGTSEWGVCSTCGAPWRRRISRAVPRGTNLAEGKRQHERVKSTEPGKDNRGIALGGPTTVTLGREVVYTTEGWERTCKSGCPGGAPVPAVVLDPFAGIATAGTTALALGRRFIGIELSERYAFEGGRRLELAASTPV